MSKLCENCVVEHCADRNRGQVVFCSSHTTKPIQTHADRIRAMSDEELAKLIYEVDGLGWCKSLPECIKAEGLIPKEKCIGCALAWLRQPAEVSGDA